MENNTNVFNYFIEPAGHVKREQRDYMLFSVCIEINGDHQVLSGNAPDAIEPWKKAVRSFPDVISKLQKKDPLLSFLIPGAANAVTVSGKWIASGFSEGTSKDFWETFLSFKAINGASEQAGLFTEFSKGLDTPLNIPQIAYLPISGTVQLPAPASPLEKTGAPLSIMDANIISFQQVLTAFNEQKAPTLGPAHLEQLNEGILEAAEIFQQAQRNRNSAILNHPANQGARSRISRLYAGSFNKSQALKLNPHQISSYLRTKQQLVQFQELRFLVTNEPPYIQEAINKINAYRPLRKLTGTLLQMELSADSVKALLAGGAQCVVSIDLNSLAEMTDYFIGQQTALSLMPGDPNLFLAAPNGLHKSGVLEVAGNCKILNYEAEQINRNLQYAGERTDADADIKEHRVALRATAALVTEKLYSSMAPSQSREWAMASFKAHRQTNAALQQTRVLNSQVTNITTKGQTVFFTKPAPAATADGAPLSETDLTAGYVVYARKVGTQKWNSLTRCLEKFIHPDMGRKPPQFEPVELGLHINPATASTVTPAQGQNGVEMTRGNDVVGIVDGALSTWDGTKISVRNPMSLVEKKPADEASRQIAASEEFLQRHEDTPLELLSIHYNTRYLFGEDWFPFKRYTLSDAIPTSSWPRRGQRGKAQPPSFRLMRQYEFTDDQLRLKFGESYEYLYATQYHNGFVPAAAFIELYNEAPGDPAIQDFVNTMTACITRPEDEDSRRFLRHEHIKDLVFSFKEDIYEKGGSNVPMAEHAGESATSLVIRSDDDFNGKTCVRYILPPPVPTFNLYLWYDRKNGLAGGELRKKDLDAGDMQEWYRKYQCAGTMESGKLVCPSGCEKFCGGTTQPSVYSGQLHYLPDPIVSGFVLRFYLDPERTLRADSHIDELTEYPETFLAFQWGIYPQLKPWKLILDNDERSQKLESKVAVDARNQEVKIRVRQGLTLYAECIPAYFREESQFHPQLPFNKEHFSNHQGNLYYNTLFSNITHLTLTHASKQPLFAPQIRSMHLYRFHKDEKNRKENDCKVVMDLHFEHLNLWQGLPIPGLQPTGELELYAIWNDYNSTRSQPSKSIEEKRKEGGPPHDGFVKVGQIRFPADPVSRPMPVHLRRKDGATPDPLRDHQSEVVFFTDSMFHVMHHTDVVFKIRNTSKFGSYFPDKNGTVAVDPLDTNKENYSLWSKEVRFSGSEPGSIISLETTATDEEQKESTPFAARSSYLFSNRKPQTPVIERIVPLVVKDVSENAISVRGNRIRVYFKNDGRNYTGKGERIGIILTTKQDVEPTLYNDLFTKLSGYSLCGFDTVTDHVGNRVKSSITKDHFVYSEKDIEKEYLQNFDPAYEPLRFSASANKIGLMTFLPARDEDQDLWYVDLELRVANQNGQPLHNAFIQLNFVHFQPMAAIHHHNAPGTQGAFDKDYRISAPIRADFVSLYPSRSLKNPQLLFVSRNKRQCVFTCFVNSLFLRDGQLASQFFIRVEKQDKYDMWQTVESISAMMARPGSPTPVEAKSFPNGELPLLLPGDYSRAINGPVEVSFNTKFDYKSGRYRVVLTEIEYHHEKLRLEQLHEQMSKSNYDLAQWPGVRVVNVVLIDE